MNGDFTLLRAPLPADQYTVVTNAFQRGELPIPLKALARCLLAYMISLPNGWKLDRGQLDRSCVEGRDAVTAALKQLEDTGYLLRSKRAGKAGLWVWTWAVTDDPKARPLTASPSTGFQSVDVTGENTADPQVEPSTGNPSTDNQSVSKKTDLEKTEKKTRVRVAYSDDFEAAWKAYGLKGAKRTAWAEWARALQRTTVETIQAAIPAYLAAHPDAKYRKDFERWLKGDVWESAECRTAGFDGAPAMTADAAEAWLLERYHAGAAEEVAARTGRSYEAPHPKSVPPGMDPAEFQLADRKQWIKYYRRGLMCVLMGQPFRNGTEVEGV
jgi:hypothetical protein